MRTWCSPTRGKDNYVSIPERFSTFFKEYHVHLTTASKSLPQYDECDQVWEEPRALFPLEGLEQRFMTISEIDFLELIVLKKLMYTP